MPRRRARATALAPTSSEAPPIVDNAAPTLFERGASAAPATPPISAAKTRSLAFDEAKSGDNPADISWALIVPVSTFTCAPASAQRQAYLGRTWHRWPGLRWFRPDFAPG